jgi:hypothetical protein
MKKLFIISTILTVLLIFSGIAIADDIHTNTAQNEAGAYANNYSDPTYNGINIEASDPMRGFTNPGGAGFPAIPSFFGPDTQGPTYQRIELVLLLKSEWKRYELDVSVTETDIMFRCRYFMKTRKTLIKELNDKTKSDFYAPLKSSLKEKPGDTIHIITAPPKGEFKMIGHITLWAEDKYTTSFELMGKACLLAMELPTAKAVLIMSQGCEKKVKTSGWGVSLGHSTATINSTQDVSTVTSPALGYSTGEAGNTGRPWLQVAIIQ